MLKPIASLYQLAKRRIAPPLLVASDLASLLAKIVPKVRDRFSFRSFWGETPASSDPYFVMDSYESVRLREDFRCSEAFPRLEFTEQFPPRGVIDGAFSPHAAAMLTDLFAQHSSKRLHVVTDTEFSPRRDSIFVCYGTSDLNSRTFDIEAESGNSLCRYVLDSNGKRAFRLTGQLHFMENRDGTLYDKAIVRRLINRPFSNHSHVICAGLSEWGSLAAVYYLTRNWRELHKRFDCFGQRKDFCLLLEVPYGQFENARELISAVWWESKSAPNRAFVANHV